MRILVVEYPIVAGFVVQGLRDAGHVVDHLPAGREATRIGLSGGYDVIVLGLALHKKPGVQVALAIRGSGTAVPILLLVSDAREGEELMGRTQADGYLTKPFRLDALLERLSGLTRRSP